MKQIDQEPHNPKARRQIIEYLIGAAVVIPIGVWLKQSGTWSEWMFQIFGW